MRKTTLKINGQPVYVSSTGKVRIGTKGAAKTPGELLGGMDKGAARAVRKAARSAGVNVIATAARAA